MAASQTTGAEPSSRRDLTGARIGRFAVRRLLGSGGMGEVYCADDATLKRQVALKRVAPQLRADRLALQHFRSEAQRASALNHPGIAGVYDLFEADGELLLVMEYVEGETLRRRCRVPLPVAEGFRLILQCAEAVAAAHQKHIAHLDLKPENIMETAGGRVKVLDFGVAHHIGPAPASATTSSAYSMGGTLPYMAPERLLGRAVDQRADVFALGVVAYELLAGRHPFAAPAWGATLDNILHGTPRPLSEANPQVSPALEAVVGRMLAKDPAQRYDSALEVVRALQLLQDPSTAATLPLVAVPRRKRRLRSWLEGALLLLVLAGGLLLASRWRHPAPAPAAMPIYKELAVLPFRVIGDGPEMQSVADGLTETLTAKLTQLTAPDTLAVAPSGEVRGLKGKTATQAHKELGVNLVLEGSLYATGDRVQVSYSLVDPNTLRSLRSEMATAPLSDTFVLEDRVIEGTLRMLEVSPKSGMVVAGRGTAVSSAYEFYLRGLGRLMNYDTPENLERAIADFSQALALDPKYALAYAGLGEANWKKFEIGKQAGFVEIARQNCQRAVELDNQAASAYVCLGLVESGTGRAAESVQAFQRALELDARNDDAYRGLAQALERLGRFREAETTYQRAIAMRPQYWAGHSLLGVFYFRRMRNEEAVAQFRIAASLAPENARPYSALGGVLSATGRYEEAMAPLQRSIELRPGPAAYINLAYVYFRLRRYDEAVVASQQALALHDGDYRAAGNLAETYYWQPGQRARSGEWFRRAIALAQQQVKVNPQDWLVHSTLAKYYAFLQDKPRAREHLRRALNGQPQDAGIQYRAAVVHNLLGEQEEALGSLEKAVALGYARNEISAAVEFDNLRHNPRLQAMLKK